MMQLCLCQYVLVLNTMTQLVIVVGAAVQCRQATGFACPEFAGYNVPVATNLSKKNPQRWLLLVPTKNSLRVNT